MSNPTRIDSTTGIIEMTDNDFKTSLENAGISGGATYSATAPSSPTSGQYWYDSVNAVFNTWDGSNWIPLQGAFFTTTLFINSNLTTTFDINSALISDGWDEITPLNLTIEVSANVVPNEGGGDGTTLTNTGDDRSNEGGNSKGNAAIVGTNFPDTSIIVINNDSTIAGSGGERGASTGRGSCFTNDNRLEGTNGNFTSGGWTYSSSTPSAVALSRVLGRGGDVPNNNYNNICGGQGGAVINAWSGAWGGNAIEISSDAAGSITLEINNSGLIVGGGGGAGGHGTNNSFGGAGGNGGDAIFTSGNVSVNLSQTSTGIIAGGGGGGGGRGNTAGNEGEANGGVMGSNGEDAGGSIGGDSSGGLAGEVVSGSGSNIINGTFTGVF